MTDNKGQIKWCLQRTCLGLIFFTFILFYLCVCVLKIQHKVYPLNKYLSAQYSIINNVVQQDV